MRSLICLVLAAGLLLTLTACAHNKEQSDSERYRAQKAQEELSKETR